MLRKTKTVGQVLLSFSMLLSSTFTSLLMILVFHLKTSLGHRRFFLVLAFCKPLPSKHCYFYLADKIPPRCHTTTSNSSQLPLIIFKMSLQL